METDLYHLETFREGIIKLKDKNKIRNKISYIKEDNNIILCWIYEIKLINAMSYIILNNIRRLIVN